MYRLVVVIILVFCMTCGMAYADTAQTRTGLQAVQQSLPALKAKLDQLKANGQDVSYPMASYTVLENFVGYALTDVNDTNSVNVTRAATELSELQTIQSDLNQQLSSALAGNLTFPLVPRYTGDTRPVINGTSFMAPTTTPGSACREIRPVIFTGFGHFSQVRADIEKWPNYGCNIIQFEIGPYSIYGNGTEINPPNQAPIQALKNDLDRAQKAGVAVNLLLSPHYFPDWMKVKYPELKKNGGGGFLQFCIHAPVGQDFLKQFITTLITPVKDHPALHSICLTNEPQSTEGACPYGTIAFRAWLQQRHGTIATLNSRWGTNFASFDAVTTPYNKSDYTRWNQEYFENWHKMLADAVHAVAPNLPVHAKVQGPSFGNANQINLGNDPYLYACATQINGNDCSNYYANPTPYLNSWLGNYMYSDLQRSMKNAPVFNSENHMIADKSTTTVPWKHIRTALWGEAIHGQSATTLWVWQPMSDPKNILYGSFMNRPLCARAVGLANLDLNRAAKEITALQQVPEQVVILHSPSSYIWDTGNEYDYVTMRTYNALLFCRARVGFISERQLEDGILPSASVLVIPNAKHISNAAFATLKRYTGRVVYLVSSSLLGYDEYNKPRSERLTATVVPFLTASLASISSLYDALSPKLISWKIAPKIVLTDTGGNLLKAVEQLEADTADGTVVNICNYYSTSVNVKLSRNGVNVSAVDVLSGETVTGNITLQPLDYRLLKVLN